MNPTRSHSGALAPHREPRTRTPHATSAGPRMARRGMDPWLALLIVTAVAFLIAAAWPQHAMSVEFECATCHIGALPDVIDTGAPEPAEEADNSADKSDDLAPEFDTSELTTSTVGPDGTYYLWIPFDMTQEAFDASETLRAQEDAYPVVEFIGPGSVYGEDE